MTLHASLRLDGDQVSVTLWGRDRRIEAERDIDAVISTAAVRCAGGVLTLERSRVWRMIHVAGSGGQRWTWCARAVIQHPDAAGEAAVILTARGYRVTRHDGRISGEMLGA